MHVGHQVGHHVHLAEGGDGDPGVPDVLQVAVQRGRSDDVLQLLGPVRAVGGQQDVRVEDQPVAAAHLHRTHQLHDVPCGGEAERGSGLQGTPDWLVDLWGILRKNIGEEEGKNRDVTHSK